MSKAKIVKKVVEMVEICGIVDNSSDAYLVYRFDSEATREKFLKNYTGRKPAFTKLNSVTKRDYKVIESTDVITDDVLEAAMATDCVMTYCEDNNHLFYDCADEIKDIPR